jgi:hypothetical protein
VFPPTYALRGFSSLWWPTNLHLRRKQAGNARTGLFMRDVLAAIKRLQSTLHCYNETRFMLQVKANHFLCQLIRIAAFRCGQFAELGFVFGRESTSIIASLGKWSFAVNKQQNG